MSEGQPRLVDNDPWVFSGGEINFDYPTGILKPEAPEGGPSIRVIFVGQVEDRFLVCLPSTVWHKKTANRKLPAGTLVKATPVSVAACNEADRTLVDEETSFKVWLGYLDADLVDVTELGDLTTECSEDFQDGRLPFAEALGQLCQDHFAFFSFGEETQEPGGEGASGSGDMSGRMAAVENALISITQSIAELSKKMEPRVTFAADSTPLAASAKAVPAAAKGVGGLPRKGALRHPPVLPQQQGLLPESSGGEGSEPALFPGLDPGVVQAAMNAGISKESLEEMQKLLQLNPKRTRALRQERKTVLSNPLSESEEEAEEPKEGGMPAGSADHPMSTAISQLTKIVTHLSQDRGKKPRSKLDAALDGALGTNADSSSGMGSKKSAVARRALRASLTEAPEEIFALIERLMAEDVLSTTMPHGMAAPTFSARSWVEHRSRIGAYKTMAHAAWGTSGILDSLRSGNISGARAKCCLLLLQLDQASIDRGQWHLASELSLEMGPPFSTLNQHQVPSVQDGESPFSRLLDPRWAELALGHLKDTEEYVQKRTQLGKKLTTTTTSNPEDDPLPVPRRRPKAKAKAKALATES